MKSQKRRIEFATIESCTYKTILAAFTEKGLCALFLGVEKEKQIQDLKRRFGDENVEETFDAEKKLQQIVGYIEDPSSKSYHIDLDENGTDFQKKVWKTLRTIPFGHTATYSDIAAQIGDPKAYRAVANACAKNPIAVITPCHRVLKKDGIFSGYYWGRDAKEKLLKAEEKALLEEKKSL